MRLVTNVADLIGLVRGAGIALDLSLQSANVLPQVLSNTANKFIGRVGSASDLDAIGAAMALTPGQKRWICTNLRPGMFVGQVGEGDWRHPFVFTVPHIRLSSAGANSLPDQLALPSSPS